MGIKNVLMCRESGYRGSWSYYLVQVQSRIGIGCRIQHMALLASLMSTHSRTLPGCLGFGTRTTGETHGVGPTAGSMMSSLRKDFTQTSRFFL